MKETELLSDEAIFAATRHCIDMWHTLDVEKTLSTYTDDVIYSDPKIKGVINGKDDLRRYLTRFFRVWDMNFRIVEERRLAGMNGQLCRWECDIQHRKGGPRIMIPGMDVVEVRGEQLSRDQAFMDTLPLMELKIQFG